MSTSISTVRQPYKDRFMLVPDSGNEGIIVKFAIMVVNRGW